MLCKENDRPVSQPGYAAVLDLVKGCGGNMHNLGKPRPAVAALLVQEADVAAKDGIIPVINVFRGHVYHLRPMALYDPARIHSIGKPRR